ncbi:MAG: hypothetical protein ACTHJV_12240 [Rhizobiaceae bacterium]
MTDETPRWKTSGPQLSKTTAPDAAEERRLADPSVKDVTNPKEVWETAGPADEPAPDENLRDRDEGREPDPSFITSDEPSPYGEEAQADIVGRQSGPGKGAADVEKPRKG